MGYIGFRLSDAEETALRTQAKNEKITLSELCRKRIFAEKASTDELKTDFSALQQQIHAANSMLSENIKALTDTLTKLDTDRSQNIRFISDALDYLVKNDSYCIAVILEILQRDILRRYTDKNAAKRLINEAYNAANQQGG